MKTLNKTVFAFAAILALSAGFWITFDNVQTFVSETVQTAFATNGCCGGVELDIPVWYLNEGGGGGGGGFYIPPQTNPVRCTLTASDTLVGKDDEVTFSWTSAHAQSGTLSFDGNGLGYAIPVSAGSITIPISETGIFSARFTGPGGTAVCRETVVVEPQPEIPECDLSATPDAINFGDVSALEWGSIYATNASIDNGIGPVTPVAGGFINVSPTETTTYKMTVSGPGGTTYCYETITVTPPQSEPPACTLDGDPVIIFEGDSTTLSWTSEYANVASIDNGVGNVTPTSAGDINVSPTQTTTYKMTVTGDGGVAYCSQKITVKPVTNYGPYCGDGVVNQSWEACDGGVSCTQQCQNQCVEMSFARVVVTDVQNDVGGDLTDDIFLGSDSYKIPKNTWFLVHDGTSYITDNDILSYDDVPGIAIQRLVGKIRARIVGSHALPNTTKEHAEGYVETFQANVTSQVNDPTPGTFYGMEKPFDGQMAINPFKDELWIEGDTKAHFYSTVTQYDDGWYTLIEEDAPSCSSDPKPACSLDADPTQIIEGGSSTLTWTTLNATSATIDNGVGSVTPIAYGDTDVSPTATTEYTMTVTGPGGTAYCAAEIAVLPDEPNTPLCTLSATPTTIDSGESSTLVWTTQNGDTFVLDQGIGTSTPTSGGSVAVSPTQTTTYTGTLTGSYGSTTCTATVTVDNGGPIPQCTLSVTPGKISSGGEITLSWTSSNVTEGIINGNVGDVSPVASGSINLFPSDDFEYVGTFSGQYGTTTCSATVDVVTGGCTGNCGGGLDQPTTLLFKKPGEQPLAFVSLSQIPYTGFEAGPMLTILFWFAVILWSMGITYVVLGQRGMQLIAARVFQYRAPMPDETGDVEVDTHTREDEYINGFASQSTHAVADKLLPMEEIAKTPFVPAQTHTVPAPTPAQPAVDGIPEIADVIESRAHAAGVLLSPEALASAKTLGGNREDTLKVFGELLNDAVRTIPREDGWVLLSSDRFDELKRSRVAGAQKEETHEAKAIGSVISETLSESTHTRLAASILSGNRDTAFTLIRSAEKEGVSATSLVTGVVKAFDSLLRSRTNGESADMILSQNASHVSDEALKELVDIFAHALDTDYASPYTGVKLALAQAFEVK